MLFREIIIIINHYFECNKRNILCMHYMAIQFCAELRQFYCPYYKLFMYLNY